MRHHNRNSLMELLSWRRSRAWKLGIIQAACTFDVITHAEWESLRDQIEAKVKRPTLPGWEPLTWEPLTSPSAGAGATCLQRQGAS